MRWQHKIGGLFMIYLPNTEDIYFAKTKEYFAEVISSYASGNYRSAVVMLYSVAICDLLFKLKELCDTYEDTRAKELLEEIEKCRSEYDNKSKSRWEKELVDRIYKETDLLDLEAYTNLNHLYDHRNFSAHPALNENYELISPSQESTIAHIKNILTSILIKPPIFIKNVMEVLLEDLDEKRDIYKTDPVRLKDYLTRKYYSRMSDSMKKSTFRSFWKLCFSLSDNENCSRNRTINRKAMEFLFELTPGILEFIKTDTMFSRVEHARDCEIQLCIFLARYPQIYTILSNDVKFQLSSIIAKDGTANIIAWFTSTDKQTHLKKILDEASFESIPLETMRFVENQYSNEGLKEVFIDFCIEYFGASDKFDEANERYDIAIRPYLNEMSQQQVICLISKINGNNQIYNRMAAYRTNTEIVQMTKEILGPDFEFDDYPFFLFNKEKVFAKITEFDDMEDLDIPF